MGDSIKVMTIDDSAVVRQALKEIIDADPDMELVAAAADPYMAADKLKTTVPDVIVLDIEMPRMDGLTFLKRLMSQHPLPVIICSSKSEKGSQNAMTALEYGAVDIITKPKMGAKGFIEESQIRFRDAIIGASKSKVNRPALLSGPALQVRPKLSADAVMPAPRRPVAIDTTESVVVVGASTGGTEALRVFLEAMPVDAPGIVIVQHMPEHFTASFARRLDSLCAIAVKEAEDNDSVLRGRALISPGNKHTMLKRSGARYFVQVKDGPLVSRHRPSVDVLFRSTARYAGKNAVGVIMTGMGDDGVQGLGEMKEAGSRNIAQDEATSIVFGMPGEAVKKGVVHDILPLNEIARRVLEMAAG